MIEKAGDESVKHLANIEDELEELNDKTANPKRSFINGIFQGAGVLVGGIAAAVLLGWILAVLGVLPGFSTVASYLHAVVDQAGRR